jgi:hypothetical protein
MDTPNAVRPAEDSQQQPGILAYVDGILRHRERYFTNIFENKDVPRQMFLLLMIIVCLSAFHGFVMGTLGALPQMLSSAVKVPLLYLLTLVVCYPVLYVVNVIMGSRLSFSQTLALILLAVAMNAILLASCAPIVLFFRITGAKYDFLKLLHVLIFAFSGVWAMLALWRGLLAMCETSNLYPRQAVRILKIWIIVFAFVGSQMAWSLRPFVGSPDFEFQLFRKGQEGNFYQAVGTSMVRLLEGSDREGAKQEPGPSTPTKHDKPE